MQWYTEVLKKYVDFSGRARRKEFWMFMLVSTIISLVLAIVDAIMGTLQPSGLGLLSGLYWVGVLLPTLAVTVRRLHDTNRHGGWIFISAIPVVGAILLIVFNATDGNRGDNKYGTDPKAAERVVAFPGGEPGYPQV
jgi:uncharacterized membrane protein YhaH (DUF805 family)